MIGGMWRAVVVCFIASSAPAVAPGQESASASSFDACNEETAVRLRFIEQRLEDGRTYAQYWGTGWMGFYGIGTIVTSVQAATDKDDGEQGDHIVSAVKAFGGTIRVALTRPTARHGADAMFAIPATSQEGCLQRLAVGEDLLRKNAKEAQSRYAWQRHFYNFAVNIGGGVIVSEGFGDPSRGLTSALIGIAVGETMTWSHPWRGTKDLADYEDKFAPVTMPKAPEVSLQLLPVVGGAAVRMNF